MSSIFATSTLRTCTRTKSPNALLSAVSFRNMSTGVPSSTAQAQQASNASDPTSNELGIENTNVKAAAGVDLSAQQKLLVGSVLDVGPTPLA